MRRSVRMTFARKPRVKPNRRRREQFVYRRHKLFPRWNEKAGLRGMRYAPNHQRARGARERRPAVKKLSTVRGRESKIFNEHNLTIGLDLGDRSSYYCVLDEASKVIQEANVGTNKKAMAMVFGSMGRCRIGMEVGTHSPWVSLTEKIKEMDRRVEQIAREDYPETRLLQQVKGVGPLIALTFVLTLEDKARFAKSRDVGCYVGLRPRRSDSGESQPQLRITKEGDAYLRKMLVQGAHYILGYWGPDTDLRRWGLKLAERGGKNAKKRAIVAVARKLAVLLHALWVSGEVYEPLRNSHARQRLKQRTA